jgi:RecJ-like exonuclease
MNKGKVRDNIRVQQKREVMDKILWLYKKDRKSKFGKKLNKKSRKELDRVLRRICNAVKKINW